MLSSILQSYALPLEEEEQQALQHFKERRRPSESNTQQRRNETCGQLPQSQRPESQTRIRESTTCDSRHLQKFKAPGSGFSRFLFLEAGGIELKSLLLFCGLALCMS